MDARKRKNIGRIVGLLLVAPFVIFVSLLTLLYLPPIQNRVVDMAARAASNATGMSIEVGQVRLALPLDLKLRKVVVSDSLRSDTIASLGELRIGVSLWPLLSGQIQVGEILLSQVQASTGALIPSVGIEGRVETLRLEAGHVSLAEEHALVKSLRLSDADVSVTLHPDTVPSDTVSSSIGWNILLDEMLLSRVNFHLQMPADTLSLVAGCGKAELEQIAVNLGKQSYGLLRMDMADGLFAYNRGNGHPLSGLDPDHIQIERIQVGVDSLSYSNEQLKATVRQLALAERSGLMVEELEGSFAMDSLGIRLPGLKVETSASRLQAYGDMEWTALQAGGEGQLLLSAAGEVGRQDVLALVAGMWPEVVVQKYPFAPLDFRLSAHGNMQQVWLDTLTAQMDSVFDICAGGHATRLADTLFRKGGVHLSVETHNLDFISLLVDTTGAFVLPHTMRMAGQLAMEATRLDATLSLLESDGTLTATGHYDTHTEVYALNGQIDSLALNHFLPSDSLRRLSAHLRMEGVGTDPYAAHTHLKAEAAIDLLEYGALDIQDVNLNAALQNHQATLSLESHNPLLDMQLSAGALVLRDSLDGHITLNIGEADLQALRLTEVPLNVSLSADVRGETDWQNTHAAQGEVTAMNLLTAKGRFAPRDIQFSAFTRLDSTSAHVAAGDMKLQMDVDSDVPSMVDRCMAFAEECWKQLGQRVVDLNEVKGLLPDATLQLNAGQDNPFSNYLRYVSGIGVEQVDLDLRTSPQSGIHGDGYVYRFSTDSLELDTISLTLRQDSSLLRYQAVVSNAPNTYKPVFTAYAGGEIDSTGGDILLRFFNEEHRKGLELGVRAALQSDGLRVSLFPERPTVGFRPFTLDGGNYVMLSDSGKVEADLALLDQRGTGLRLYSIPNDSRRQDLTLDLTRLDLAELLSLLPYAPDVAGILDTELHYIQETDGKNTLSATMQVDGLVYEKYSIGALGAEAAYLPLSVNEHLVSLQLLRDGTEVATVDGTYFSADDGYHTSSGDTLSAYQLHSASGEARLQADISLEHFPLDMANAFLPRELVNMEGALMGELTVQGPLSAPLISGELRFDSVKMHSPLYALDFTFDKNPLSIRNNLLTFDQFNIYAHGKNPFTLTGEVDMGDFSRMTADLRMQAREYELLNVRENKNSLLHGKVFVSLFSTIKGGLTNPVVRGTMNVLGNTDVTYILKESPLTVEDRLGSMVTFVNFNDTVTVPDATEKVSLGGLDLLLNVQIDQGAQVQVDLGSDSYVEVQGGGNLSMQYTPQGDFLLMGRYTLTSGEMKYSLPVIPLKTFKIKSGSYVEFTGDPANPYLNVTATERVRTSVTEDNSSRYVNFDVGVSITNSLSDMGLAFMLEAPEDASLQNQLAAMSAEERGKLAVTMLVTGMYAGSQGGTSGGFNTGNALNSFLQSEISHIAGSALKTVDISIGVEDKYAADGSSQGGTDYSFQFAKRFWNNRLSVIIGGRISTGSETVAEEEGNSFIDDISLEWRLDDSGTRYVKLFHTKNYESILEGEIIETGVGLVLRRKVNKLGELFIFKRRKDGITKE